MKAVSAVVCAGSVLLAASQLHERVAAQSASPTYRAEQAAQGKDVYSQSCASCHGANLDDGEFAPPLKGVEFRQQWGGRGADVVFDYMTSRMPPGTPGTLGDDRYAQILAYILQENGVAPGTRELPSDVNALRTMLMPASAAGAGGGLSSGIALPPPPASRANPLDRWTPVSDSTLSAPAEGDWLTWRRGFDAQGFSPLRQITKSNVGELRVAWTWSLPPGANENTPLVHNGVLFVQSFGDKVQALDAATGDLLWQYSRRLPKGSPTTVKRAFAIYGDRLYMPTSDTHIVALDIRTGKVVWDEPVADYKAGYGMTGGPLVARGKVMVGTTGRAPGGNFIVALDANTGKEAWRFYAIARPGEPGGDTWNGLDVDKRNGASVWVPGSYDAALNLAFFGPAQTYDTGPLRNLSDESLRNDGLYTDSTLAINPDTGRLVWYFQHQPNDQWDLDWAFERHLIKLPVNGAMKTVVVTGGKQAIFDVMEADSGKYVFSMDLGIQNVVTAIDPRTGAKRVNPRQTPGDGEAKLICPHAGGGKSWLPSSYNPSTKTLFIPLVESCMDLTPVAPGGRGSLSTGVRWTLRPRPESDGRYGRVQAINLETRKVVWIERHRAPQTTGVLATAGGVVFAGTLDRVFAAYDDATGKELWRIRLNDVPSSAPISYLANGKQYIAMVVGNGGAQAATFPQLVPEIQNPPDRSAAIWVFEIPSKTTS